MFVFIPPKVCNVSIKLHNDERPEVQKNAGVSLEYGDSALISSVVLVARDEDNDETHLAYIIVEVRLANMAAYHR